MGLLDELRGDLVGEWLPVALADLLGAWTGDTRGAILESWGFRQPPKDTAKETDRALAQLFSGNA